MLIHGGPVSYLPHPPLNLGQVVDDHWDILFRDLKSLLGGTTPYYLPLTLEVQTLRIVQF